MRRTFFQGKGRHAALVLAAIAAVLGPPLSAGAGLAAAAGGGYAVLRLPLPQFSSQVAVDPSTDTLYFAANSDGQLSVVNGATGAVTARLNLGDSVRGVAVDPVTDMVYVGLFDNIDVINGATNKVTATIDQAEFSYPSGVAVDAATNTVYVANSGPSGRDVVVINGATNKVKTTISTGPHVAPFGIAVDSATDIVWVAEENGNVIAIDGAKDTIKNTVAAGDDGAVEVAVNTATDTVYVPDTKDGALAVIDGATATVTKDIPVGSTFLDGVAVDQNSGKVYVASYSINDPGTTSVIDGTSNTVLATLPRGGYGMTVNQATGTAYEDANWGPDAWVIKSSAMNSLSPLITTLDGVWLNEGQNNSDSYIASAIPPATFTETGALPKGVTVNSAGLLSGVPAAGTGGVYLITLTASNGVGLADSEPVYVSVAQSPAITSAAAATLTAGHAGSFALQATGYPSPAFSTTGTLPSGVAITSNATGWQLSGTPGVGTGGVYKFTLIAANNIGSDARQQFTLTVRETPLFTSAPRATFRAGSRGSYLIQVDGYPAARLTEAGRLPWGVTLHPGGRLAGTPGIHAGGSYRLTITARNGVGDPVKQAFTLTVDQVPAIVSAQHATFRTGRENIFTIRATGFPAVRLSEHGSLPAGIRLVAHRNGTAVLKGKPSLADIGKTFVFTIVAKNGVSAGARQRFKLKILEG